LNSNVDTSKLTPGSQIAGEDAEDTALLVAMREDAARYLKSFEWCTGITETWFGCGVGGVFAVFLCSGVILTHRVRHGDAARRPCAALTVQGEGSTILGQAVGEIARLARIARIRENPFRKRAGDRSIGLVPRGSSNAYSTVWQCKQRRQGRRSGAETRRQACGLPARSHRSAFEGRVTSGGA